MKPWLRFLIGLGAVLFISTAAHAQLSPTGITASPGSANPGDAVTFSIAVSNSGALFNGTADFSITLTNITTGYSFTLTATGVSPKGGFIPALVPAAPPAQSSPGTGSFEVTAVIPTKVTEAGPYRATVVMTPPGGAAGTFSVSSTVLTVTGKPDFKITALTYAGGTSYKG